MAGHCSRRQSAGGEHSSIQPRKTLAATRAQAPLVQPGRQTKGIAAVGLRTDGRALNMRVPDARADVTLLA